MFFTLVCEHRSSKASSFKRTRTMIEKALKGEQPHDFQQKVAKAEKDLQEYKADFQRYSTLERSYSKGDTRKKDPKDNAN